MEKNSPLKQWRLDQKLSPEEAAKRNGVTLPMWSRWENGKRQVPAERVLQMEQETGVSRHELRPDVFGKAEQAA